MSQSHDERIHLLPDDDAATERHGGSVELGDDSRGSAAQHADTRASDSEASFDEIVHPAERDGQDPDPAGHVDRSALPPDMAEQGVGTDPDRDAPARDAAHRDPSALPPEVAEREAPVTEPDPGPAGADRADREDRAAEPGGAGAEQWQRMQGRFVDDPAGAVREAAGLVEEAVTRLRESVPSPSDASSPAAGATEDLRLAFQRYREVYRVLVG